MQIKCGAPSKVTCRVQSVTVSNMAFSQKMSAKKPGNSPYQHNLNKPSTGTIARIKRTKHLLKRLRTDSYKSRQYTEVPLNFLKGNTTMCNRRDTLNGVKQQLRLVSLKRQIIVFKRTEH